MGKVVVMTIKALSSEFDEEKIKKYMAEVLLNAPSSGSDHTGQSTSQESQMKPRKKTQQILFNGIR